MKQKNIKEIVSYIFIGGMTTFINYLVYFFLIRSFHCTWLFANTIAWLAAVVFAFGMNRNYVFQSKNSIYKEGLMFATMRLITLVVENILLFIFIQIFKSDIMLSKVLVSFITVISNYGLCKYKIFQKPKGELNYEKN